MTGKAVARTPNVSFEPGGQLSLDDPKLAVSAEPDIVIDSDNLSLLTADCTAIIVESNFQVSSTLIISKWSVGAAICRDPQYIKSKGGRGTSSFIRELGRALRETLSDSQRVGWGTSEVYRCVQFFEATDGMALDNDPDGGLKKLAVMLGEGKNLSWTSVKRFLLPITDDDEGAPDTEKEKEKVARLPPVDREGIAQLSGARVGRVWSADDHKEIMEMIGV